LGLLAIEEAILRRLPTDAVSVRLEHLMRAIGAVRPSAR
jgi:hypothetical protein